ncbi:MAG: L,D-transpeptidase family protein [Candidatus Yanofskybacteria bacterium]|nr:L,D-transpeptidase family protein [Candidatus Yanofskybacteria bacterium]
MVERITIQERPVAAEKSREELYVDALRLKREVLSSKTEMDSVRREVNKRINETNENEFKTDPQVVEYERIGREYDRKRKLFLGSLEKLSDEDKERINQMTNLSKIEAELSPSQQMKDENKRLRFGIETPETEKEISLDDVEKMFKYAKDTGRLLELAYWESKKEELRDKYYEDKDKLVLPEINKMIDYSLNTGRPLELAYWESRKSELKKGQRIFSEKPEEKQLEKPPEYEQEIRIEEQRPTEQPIEHKELKTPVSTSGSRQEGSDISITEKLIITLEKKDKVDGFLIEVEKTELPSISAEEKIVEQTSEADKNSIDTAIDEQAAPLENLVRVETIPEPERKPLLKRLREHIRRRALVYAGAGLLSILASKGGEAYEYMPKTAGGAVKVLDKLPDAGSAAFDFTRMAASEAVRYSVKPYLVARYVGSNDYFGLEAIKIADAIGMEDTAENMFERSLAGYIDGFSETRSANRFTTIDKHTVRGYMDTFVSVYSDNEQPDSGLETYGKFINFLNDNFGAAKAYEFALKLSSEENLPTKLADVAKKDLVKHETILRKAAGKSNIYFNQEEGIFNVIADGNLIDTYTSRAGFMNVPQDGSPAFKSMGYGRTPDGQFKISSIEYGYSTLRWKDSFLPYGAEIRLGGSGEVEYKYRDKWYPATGPEATYFDQGNKVQPNKSEKHLKHLKERSRGESLLTKLDFYTMDGLMERWEKNPFGPISYRLAGRAELIHSNPTDSDNILHPSHGCIRLDKEDVKVLEKYIGTGTSKIRISFAAGESWRSAS